MKINLYFFVLEVSIESTNLRRRIQKTYTESGKIYAIKKYRQLTGATLKEAKDYVDALPTTKP